MEEPESYQSLKYPTLPPRKKITVDDCKGLDTRQRSLRYVRTNNMADAYEGVSRGSLKLKGVADGGVKK